MYTEKYAINPQYIINYGLNNIETLEQLRKLLEKVYNAIPNRIYTDNIKEDLHNFIIKMEE